MNWNQIENNWVAMTRRMRSDWSAPLAGDRGPAAPDESVDTTLVDPALTLTEDRAPIPGKMA